MNAAASPGFVIAMTRTQSHSSEIFEAGTLQRQNWLRFNQERMRNRENCRTQWHSVEVATDVSQSATRLLRMIIIMIVVSLFHFSTHACNVIASVLSNGKKSILAVFDFALVKPMRG